MCARAAASPPSLSVFSLLTPSPQTGHGFCVNQRVCWQQGGCLLTCVLWSDCDDSMPEPLPGQATCTLCVSLLC